MTFPLERILTISARDYCEMYGKLIQQYEAKGIHFREHDPSYLDLPKKFAKSIPEGTEVVVEYRFSNGGDYNWQVYYASGTALIPKKK